MIDLPTELHPLEPFFPEGTKLLMLGSFPPARKRWKMEFYYPNFQNDMWRIFGWVFFENKEYFLTQDRKSFDEVSIKDFLNRKGIALSDTAREVIRQKGNASDKFLEIVHSIDLQKVLEQLPECRALVTTGQKATDTLFALLDAPQPSVGGYVGCNYNGRDLRIYRMPSSSRAYPKPLEEKARIYRQMFCELGMLSV